MAALRFLLALVLLPVVFVGWLLCAVMAALAGGLLRLVKRFVPDRKPDADRAQVARVTLATFERGRASAQRDHPDHIH